MQEFYFLKEEENWLPRGWKGSKEKRHQMGFASRSCITWRHDKISLIARLPRNKTPSFLLVISQGLEVIMASM